MLFIRFLKIVLKENTIYINAIVFEVTESYSKFNASLGYDLILAIVISKCGQIFTKRNRLQYILLVAISDSKKFARILVSINDPRNAIYDLFW